MKFIETTNKKDAHTEEWIVIILSVIFAYLINKLFLSLTNSTSITASLVVLIASMSIFSITYYYGKDKLQQRLKSKKLVVSINFICIFPFMLLSHLHYF